MNERKFANSAYYRGTGKVIVDTFTGQMVKYARNEAELWCSENNIHKKHRIDAKIEAWCLYVRGKNIKKALSHWWQEHRKRELFELERELQSDSARGSSYEEATACNERTRLWGR